jgi:maltose phosphorylase
MGTTQDSYIEIDPWKIIERGFHPEKARVSESLFSLANEHIGVRGSFDEGFSGSTLRGCYVNGIYEEHVLREPSGYRGVSNRIRFMVNTVDWLHLGVATDGETLDLATSIHADFVRELDLSNGLLRRTFLWRTHSGKEIECVFQRLLSMRRNELGAQRLSFKALNFTGEISLTLGLDFSIVHECYSRNYWRCPRMQSKEGSAAILGVSTGIGHKLFAGFHSAVSVSHARTACSSAAPGDSGRFVGRTLTLPLVQGRETAVEKISVLFTTGDPATTEDEAWARGTELLQSARGIGFDDVLRDNASYWAGIWDASDIVIDGDPESQQGIRFCIFQLQQTCRGIVHGAHVAAKGLTGEAYNGHTFWDTEIYCLPHYLFTNPHAARALIDFRHATLAHALRRATELDCVGACFPVATIDGTESCTLWQHASLQIQPTTAVAYAIRHYVSVTGDRAYLYERGVAILVQICRFLASRGQWSSRGKRFGYYAVMGPDEFHMMVNNNAYTNVMAKETFLYTLRVMEEMRRDRPPDYEALVGASACGMEEQQAWRERADAMIIPCDPQTGVFEQHEGYFDLPHIDIASIPAAEFPLYAHWSYDRIFRYDMIKQPDVLMFLFLFDGNYSREQKKANYDYYKVRCIHESSLSPSVHSILAAELGQGRDAIELFRFATRVDLDNYNRNTSEGLHMTSIAAAWMNIVYGFGGMRSDGDTLALDPGIPDQWQGYRFQVVYRGSTLRVEVTRSTAVVRLMNGPCATVAIGGELRHITKEGSVVPLKRMDRSAS